MEKELIAQHYYNHGMRTTVVAAVVEGKDFAVYLGATLEVGFTEEAATGAIHQYGTRLPEEIGRAFFPNIAEPYRR